MYGYREEITGTNHVRQGMFYIVLEAYFYRIDHDCLIVFNLYGLQTFLLGFALCHVLLAIPPLHACASATLNALNRNWLAIW